MLTIEPLSQSDRASSQLLLFRLTGTQSRVSLFARPDISSGERKRHEHQADTFRSADYGNLPELQKRDDGNGSHTDLVRRRPRGCHLQVQRVSFGNEAHVQTTFGRVATHSPHSCVSSTSTISLTSQSRSVTFAAIAGVMRKRFMGCERNCSTSRRARHGQIG